MRRRLAEWHEFGPKVVILVDYPAKTYSVHLTADIDGVIGPSAAHNAERHFDRRTGKVSMASQSRGMRWTTYHTIRTDGLPFDGREKWYVYIFPCKRGDSVRVLQSVIAQLTEGDFTCTNGDPEEYVQALMGMDTDSTSTNGDADADGCPREVCTD